MKSIWHIIWLSIKRIVKSAILSVICYVVSLIINLYDDMITLIKHFVMIDASFCEFFNKSVSWQRCKVIIPHIVDRKFLVVSFIIAWKQKNLKTRLKIDTPPFIHVCIFSRNIFNLNTLFLKKKKKNCISNMCFLCI